MNVNSEEHEDLKTKKKRDISLPLTDQQYYRLCRQAYSCGAGSVGEFLASFVADLTGYHSNGQDEEYIAEEWEERTFGVVKDNKSFFRFYLWSYDLDEDVGELQEILEDESYFQERYRQYREEAGAGTDIESEEDCRECIRKLLKQLGAEPLAEQETWQRQTGRSR